MAVIRLLEAAGGPAFATHADGPASSAHVGSAPAGLDAVHPPRRSRRHLGYSVGRTRAQRANASRERAVPAQRHHPHAAGHARRTRPTRPCSCSTGWRAPAPRRFWRPFSPRSSPASSVGRFVGLMFGTLRRLIIPELTFAAVLALAYVMNYSGATATLGLVAGADGRAVPVLQRLSRVARCVPDRKRHVRERALRQPAGHQRAGLVAQPRADGRGELHGRRARQDGVAAEHRGRHGGDGHVARQRGQAVSVHPAAQHRAHDRHGDDRAALRVRVRGGDAERCKPKDQGCRDSPPI